MISNIFIHDAVPTWSGFLYQGQIAVYLAVRQICELDKLGKRKKRIIIQLKWKSVKI